MKQDTKSRRSAIGSLGLTDDQLTALNRLANDHNVTPSQMIAQLINAEIIAQEAHRESTQSFHQHQPPKYGPIPDASNTQMIGRLVDRALSNEADGELNEEGEPYE